MNITDKKHEKFMRACFMLARKAEGKTSPNPMVGAVLVDDKGVIVSKGYHKGYGLAHAEVDCINNYEKSGGRDYFNLTLYVNLEPCNHYGKTPPCSDLIIKKGIKNVVIAAFDPNFEHTGGVEKLRAANVNVITGILEDEAVKLNEVFFKNANEQKPFVAIKTATTLDGKIASKTGSSKWITSEKSRSYVQKLRNKYDSILTSSATVNIDNPSLTARGKGYKNPIRLIVDSSLKTSPKSKVYNLDDTKVVVFYCEEKYNKIFEYPKKVSFVKINKDKENKADLKRVINEIYKMGINSVLVEAGGTLCGELLKQNLVDKIYHFVAPKILGDKAAKNFIEGFDVKDINKCRNFKITTFKYLNPDIFIELYPSN